MIEEFERFLDLVLELRTAQRLYFRYRFKEQLVRARDLETAVDKMLQKHGRVEQPEGGLFR